MKALFRITLATCVLLCLTIVSCSKEDNGASASLRETLIAKKWKLGKVVVGGVDLTSSVKGCDRDNYLKFSSDGNYNVHSDGAKCDPNEPEIVDSGTWALSTDEKTFTLDGQDETVVSHTSNSVVVKTVSPFGEVVTTYTGY
jgi:hypothetical protein